MPSARRAAPPSAAALAAGAPLVLALAAVMPAAAAAQAPPPAEQVAAAVLPLPAELRAGATVLGYDAAGRLTTLRRGTGAMVCLADDPRAERFHVACYHRDLEPFMARGRELRASGVTGAEVDSVRFREIAAGRLALPRRAMALFSLTGPAGSWNAAAGSAPGARPLYVVYLPFATAETTGVPTTPQTNAPWLMFPGTPKAHLMFTPDM